MVLITHKKFFLRRKVPLPIFAPIAITPHIDLLLARIDMDQGNIYIFN